MYSGMYLTKFVSLGSKTKMADELSKERIVEEKMKVFLNNI